MIPDDLNPGALRHSNMVYLGLAAASVAAVTLSSPEILTLADGETERDAVLLECCTLADKRLTITEADLDGIVSRFTSPVPVKLEHIDTPLDPLGTVQRVWRDGKRLLGKIALPPDVAALVRARGCKALSCGLSREPLALAELSLVLKPRLAAATLLSDSDQAELVRLRAEADMLRAERVSHRLAQVDSQVVALKLAGKLVPASEAAARVLLGVDDLAVVTLASGGTQAVSAAFLTYLAAQPVVITLGELAALSAPDATSQAGLYGSATGNGSETTAVTLDADQRAFLSRSLGVNPDHVEATMTADKKKAAAEKVGTIHAPGHPSHGHSRDDLKPHGIGVPALGPRGGK